MASFWGGKGRKKNTVATQDTCGFCRQAIKQDSKHCGLFYTVSALEEEGGKIHKECWQAYQEKTAVKCLHCQGPIAHLPGSFSGRFFTSDEPTGQVHSECWETFCAAKPSKPKELCSHCTEPIAAVENKFSGRYFELDGGIKLHFECRAVYYGANTPKCLHCSAAVTPLEGKFSGEFYEVQGEQGDGRVHCECYEAWMAASAPECLVCGEAVMKQGRFCGEYCAFDDGKTHKECAMDYIEQIAAKCVHCGKGVLKAGSFSGSYYPVGDDGGDKVHVECWEDWNAKGENHP